jgi:ATP-dependent helicase/nuclease subunit A
VFIVGCGKRARSNTNDEEIYAAGDGGLSFNPPAPPECSRMDDLGRNFFYERDRLEEKRKGTAELRRLLYVAMTRAENRLIITGAYSLGEGTFFGLLLPALTEQPSFLTMGSIPRRSREDIQRREQGERAYFNDRRGLSRFLADAAPRYEKAGRLATPALERDHLSPTSFYKPGGLLPEGGLRADPAFAGEMGADIFVKVDRLLSRLAEQGGVGAGESFGPAEFGTIAHLCVEALLKGEESAIPPRLAGRLKPGEAEDLLAAGKDLAERFLRSPLGKAAANYPFRRSENSIRSFYPRQDRPDGKRTGLYISGTIDLLFEREDQVWVVDFKTDSVENPLEHLPQMAFYHRAAGDLREKPCRVWLYYLRTGHAVETTISGGQH